jgi:hypothetical protein
VDDCGAWFVLEPDALSAEWAKAHADRFGVVERCPRQDR